jgi:hypothetical protein
MADHKTVDKILSVGNPWHTGIWFFTVQESVAVDTVGSLPTHSKVRIGVINADRQSVSVASRNKRGSSCIGLAKGGVREARVSQSCRLCEAG